MHHCTTAPLRCVARLGSQGRVFPTVVRGHMADSKRGVAKSSQWRWNLSHALRRNAISRATTTAQVPPLLLTPSSLTLTLTLTHPLLLTPSSLTLLHLVNPNPI
jgi:hypothetical protein